MAEGGGVHPGQIHRRGGPGPHRIGDEEIAQFRELHAQGLIGYQIARLTGWGKSAVYRHLWQGTRKPRWTDEENQALIDCYAEGGDKKALAARLGRSPRAIYIAMCRYRKLLRADPKKRRVLSAISYAFRAVKKADIFRELEE